MTFNLHKHSKSNIMSNSNKLVLLFFLILFITSACDSPKENPLKGLSSGIWAPTTNLPIGLGIQNISINGEAFYNTPFLIIDHNATTLSYYNSISNMTDFPVEKNEEGNWQTRIYGLGTLLLKSNPSKDTLFCFFENEQGELEKINYIQLINSKTKITVDQLKKQLRGTTWNLNHELKIVFHKLPGEVDGVNIFSHYINIVDSSNIKDIVGSSLFQENNSFVFINFKSQDSYMDETFVVKSIDKAQLELQLIPLISGVNDSILVLKKDIQDIPYVDSLRKTYIIAAKKNEAM